MNPDNLLTQKEVMARLRVSPKKLQLMRRAGQIAFLRFGHRTIRFAESEVKRFLRQGAQ